MKYNEPFGEIIVDAQYHLHDRPKFLSEASADFWAGLLGGCAGLAFGHPFDTIKVRQQTSSAEKLNVMNCVKNTLAKEGMRGFFKGMAFPLGAVGILNSIFFGVYGNCLRMLRTEGQNPTYGAIFIAGSLAGAVQAIPACPIDLVKVKLQTQKGLKSQGPMKCLTSIYREHGLKGTFRGLNATILREIPGFSVYITSYQFMCDQMTKEGETTSVPVMLVAGGFAGQLSWIVNIPIDIVKSRLQADNLANPRYSGFLDCAVKSYRADGWRIFWRGLPVTCMRAFPTNAVTFVVYSKTLEVLKRYAKEGENECYDK